MVKVIQRQQAQIRQFLTTFFAVTSKVCLALGDKIVGTRGEQWMPPNSVVAKLLALPPCCGLTRQVAKHHTQPFAQFFPHQWDGGANWETGKPHGLR